MNPTAGTVRVPRSSATPARGPRNARAIVKHDTRPGANGLPRPGPYFAQSFMPGANYRRGSMVEGLGQPTDFLGRFRLSVRTTLFRNSFVLLVTSVVAYGLGFLFWLVVARVYPAPVVGLGATLLSATGFLASAATLGLPIGIIRFLPEERDKAGLINASITVAAVASGIGGIAFLAGLPLWAPALTFVREDPALAAATVLSILAFAVAVVVDAAFVAARRPEYGMVRSTLHSGLRLPLPLAMAAVLGVLGIVLSWLFALLISVVVGVFFLLPRVFPQYRGSLTFRALRNPSVLRYSLWNQATVIVGTASLSLLPILVLNTPGPRGGASAAAYFFTALAIASLLYVVPGSFSMSLFVEGSHPDTWYGRDLRRATWFSMAFLGLGVVGAIVLGRWILGVFGADYARESYETLVLLSLAGPLVLVNTIFTTDLRVAKRVRGLFAITAVSTLVTLVLAWLLLPGIGIWGAAVGFAFGQVLAFPMFLIERRANGS